jgi:hypothetical protein
MSNRTILTEVKQEQFVNPVENATKATLKLALPIAESTVSRGDKHDLLIDADMQFVGEMKFAVSGDTEKVVMLGPTKDSWLGWLNPQNWVRQSQDELRSYIRLTPRIPLTLDIQGGIGESRLDLTGLNITRLEMSGGIGEVEIILPGEMPSVQVSLQVGVGQIELVIPPGTGVQAQIKGGVGETEIRLPPNAAVRIEASSGIGNLDIRYPGLKKLSGDDGFLGFMGVDGVWETEGYNLATHPIHIRYEGGVGQLEVR